MPQFVELFYCVFGNVFLYCFVSRVCKGLPIQFPFDQPQIKMEFRMTLCSYLSATLIFNIVGHVSSEEYICTDPSGGNGPFSPSPKIVNLTDLHIRNHRRIVILHNNSFACYKLLEVCYWVFFLWKNINVFRGLVYQSERYTKISKRDHKYCLR